MADQNRTVTIRIPAPWVHPSEMMERLPDGCEMLPERMRLSDGSEFELEFRPPDDQFADVFASVCRREPTDEEKRGIENYQVQACLSVPSESFESALRLMRAADAMLRAGGWGVFVDNSGVSLGSTFYQSLVKDASRAAISFAFVSVVRGDAETRTAGFQIVGLPDVVMRNADTGDQGEAFLEMIEYMCESERKVADGHVVADIHGPRFHVIAIPDPETSSHPLHNPLGRLRLTSVKDIAEMN